MAVAGDSLSNVGTSPTTRSVFTIRRRACRPERERTMVIQPVRSIVPAVTCIVRRSRGETFDSSRFRRLARCSRAFSLWPRLPSPRSCIRRHSQSDVEHEGAPGLWPVELRQRACSRRRLRPLSTAAAEWWRVRRRLGRRPGVYKRKSASAPGFIDGRNRLNLLGCGGAGGPRFVVQRVRRSAGDAGPGLANGVGWWERRSDSDDRAFAGSGGGRGAARWSSPAFLRGSADCGSGDTLVAWLEAAQVAVVGCRRDRVRRGSACDTSRRAGWWCLRPRCQRRRRRRKRRRCRCWSWPKPEWWNGGAAAQRRRAGNGANGSATTGGAGGSQNVSGESASSSGDGGGRGWTASSPSVTGGGDGGAGRHGLGRWSGGRGGWADAVEHSSLRATSFIQQPRVPRPPALLRGLGRNGGIGSFERSGPSAARVVLTSP